MESLSHTLFGKVRSGILGLLYGKPDELFYVREIVRVLKAGQGSVQRELKLLEKAGVILRTEKGSQVYYGANHGCSIYAELCSMVLKTAALAEILKIALQEFEDEISLALVYGSMAKGTGTSESDVDLLIVSDVDSVKLHRKLMDAEEKIGRPLNYTCMSNFEFKEKKKEKGGFLDRILNGSTILIIGEPDVV